jgi:hypothetical protein
MAADPRFADAVVLGRCRRQFATAVVLGFLSGTAAYVQQDMAQTALAARQMAAVVQLGKLSTPLDAFRGWATCAFAISRRERVAYLFMPKAGSSSIRAVLHAGYNLGPGVHRFPGDFHPDDTYFAAPPGSLPREFMLSFYQGRFVEEGGPGGPLQSNQSVPSLEGYYKFTFVTDPVDHLVRGFCQVQFWKKDLCLQAVRSGAPSEELVHNFAREIWRIYRVLGGDGRHLDVHLAPQLWLLRAAARCGEKLDFAARLSEASWAALAQDMRARGYMPPGPLLSSGNKKSFANLTAMLFATASAATVRRACATLSDEYALFGLPPRADGLCAGRAAHAQGPLSSGASDALSSLGLIWRRR